MFHNKGHERFALLGLASGGDRLLNECVVIAIMKYSVIVAQGWERGRNGFCRHACGDLCGCYLLFLTSYMRPEGPW